MASSLVQRGGGPPAATYSRGCNVDIGLSVTTAHPRSADARTAAGWVVERAAAAREAGFASFSVGDHHATSGHYLQNVPILARCLAELGTMPVYPLFLLPLWHPVLLAEQIGTLAAVAQGPLHCIVAAGAGREQFAALGASERDRAERMEEGLPLLRRLLREDGVSHEGKRWSLREVSLNPKPATPPQFWIGADVKVAIRRAARLGDAWLAGPGETEEALRTKLAWYTEALASAERQAALSVFPLRRDVYVGESDAEAEATAAPLVAAGYRGFDPSVLIVGGADAAIAKLQELETLGFNHVMIRFLPVGQQKILASIRRVGAEVVPALRSSA